MNRFPRLLEPIAISGLQLRNRVVKAPMFTKYATGEGSVTPQMIAHYREHARGGAGLVIVEFAYVDEVASKYAPLQLGVENDEKVEGLSRLAEAIRSEGAGAALQICHAGIQRTVPGEPPRVPSASAAPPGKAVREVDEEEISGIVASFAAAARRAKGAGFDLVEIHAAHGYLLTGFLSSATNRRTDGFGGDLKGRLRFPLMVVEAVRRAVGEGFPVGVRMNGSELYPGGIEVKEASATARAFADAGVHVIHVSAGVAATRHLRSTPMYGPRGNLVPLAADIRKAVSVPVIASGGLGDPAGLEAIIREGRADMVSMARQLHADPLWAKKVAEGRAQDIRPCIRCNAGCLGNVLRGKPSECDVNPATGHEMDYEITPAGKPRRVAVIGGGPAGMEAARILAVRGHAVSLFEARDRLGGALLSGARPAFKADLRAFLAFQERQLSGLPLEVRLNAPIRPEDLPGLGAETVVVATGAVPKWPREIAGSENRKVLTAQDALLNEERVGPRAVVIGAGTVGCETAWHLARLGRNVTLLEVQKDLAPDMEGIHRTCLVEGFEQAGVQWRVGAEATAVADDGTVVYRLNGTTRELPADTVILAVGVEPDRTLIDALKRLRIPFHLIGDCAKPGRIFGAMHDAARVGRAI